MFELCLHCVKSVQMWSFFWSVFSRIRTKYGEIRRKSLYSVRIRENTDQKKTLCLDIFHAVLNKKNQKIFLPWMKFKEILN